MSKKEYRQSAGSIREIRVTSDGRGRLVADVMQYGVVDDYRTSFDPEVFVDSLGVKMPAILWAHDDHDPIGRWVDADNTRSRLRLAGQLDLAMIPDTNTPAVPSAHRAWAQLNSGTINEFSVGFCRQAEERNKPRQGVTLITKAILDEASPILVGSVPGTGLVSIRSAGGLQREGRLTFFPSEITAGRGYLRVG